MQNLQTYFAWANYQQIFTALVRIIVCRLTLAQPAAGTIFRL